MRLTVELNFIVDHLRNKYKSKAEQSRIESKNPESA